MDGDCGHRCVCSGENSAFAHRRGVDEDREQYQGGGRGEYFTRRGGRFFKSGDSDLCGACRDFRVAGNRGIFRKSANRDRRHVFHTCDP